MMTEREALKLALEAFDYIENNYMSLPAPAIKAITAIKEALAQPEQHQDWCASLTQILASMPPKPALCNCKPQPVIDKTAAVRIATALGWEPKRTWVGLTDEEYSQLHDGLYQDGKSLGWVVDQVEAKLREKNAVHEEPVAAQCKFDGETLWAGCSIEHYNLVKSEPHKWPQYQVRLLYTTPQPAVPERKPLTNEEIEDIWNRYCDEIARAIEAAVWEKQK